MTHQPPLPQAATSPYPLHPAPIAASAKPAPANDRDRGMSGGLSSTILGIGAAFGIGAVAAIGGLVYARRRSAAAKPNRSGSKDTRTRGGAGSGEVAVSRPYEVTYFARKHKISASVARDILREAGSDRKAANALANERVKAAAH